MIIQYYVTSAVHVFKCSDVFAFANVGEVFIFLVKYNMIGY